MRWGKDALVIIHLSSLDTFYDYAGPELAYIRAAEMCGEIKAADENGWPIVVLDRRWPVTDDSMVPREDVLEALDEAYNYVWLSHDEGEEAWGPSESQSVHEALIAVLRLFGVKRVLLSGGWFDTEEPWVSEVGIGCAGGVARELTRAGFKVRLGTLLSMQDADEAMESSS